MRYTLLLHYPEMTAEELGEDALAEGMAAKADEFNRAGGEFYIPIHPAKS